MRFNCVNTHNQLKKLSPKFLYYYADTDVCREAVTSPLSCLVLLTHHGFIPKPSVLYMKMQRDQLGDHSFTHER